MVWSLEAGVHATTRRAGRSGWIRSSSCINHSQTSGPNADCSNHNNIMLTHRRTTTRVNTGAEREGPDRRLRELQSEVFHAARLSAVGQMAATLAHELNQVMTAAANFVNASRRLLASGDRHKIDTVPKVMDEAAVEILRAGRIIGRLRAFVSRGETERRVENVVTMIEESTALALIGTETSVRTSFHFDPKAERVFADRVQIQQVLVNLMRNAVEAMARCRRRELEVKTELLDDQTVEIAIVD